MCLQKTYFIFKNTNRLKAKKMEKIYHASNDKCRAEVAILISEKNKL